MSLGIIGGMGPMATVYFMELVVDMTEAHADGDHLEMIVYNCPSIPDRTKYIIGESEESPLPKMMEIGQRLQEQAVDCVAIPCMTAHYFYDDLKSLGIPVIHAIRETAQVLKEKGITRAALMATDGTISSGIFQRELERLGIEAVLPDSAYQKKIMDIIYEDIKAGVMPAPEKVSELKDYFINERGAQSVVLGCTELSLLKKPFALGEDFIDTLEVLAEKAILACGKQVKKEI